MKIEFKRTPEQLQLIKAMASKDRSVATQAREAFAALVGPVLQEVLQQASTSALFYRDFTFDQDDNPEIPLDLYVDAGKDTIRVWSQEMPGGLATNVYHGQKVLRFSTYRLDSAISWLEKTAQKGRLDHVAKGLERMAQEILIKQEKNAWVPILIGLANATTNGLAHVISATGSGIFQVDDVNRLWTRISRINTSWTGGTPTTRQSRGLTDLVLSPEMMEQVRSWAYQPMNTRGVPNSDESTALGMPESFREKVFNNAGLPEIYGLTLHTINELGAGQEYNVLFDSFYGGSFSGSSNDLIIGVDLARDGLIRPVEVDEDGGQVVVYEDDQFVKRQEQFGFYAKVDEGRVLLDDRVLAGIII